MSRFDEKRTFTLRKSIKTGVSKSEIESGVRDEFEPLFKVVDVAVSAPKPQIGGDRSGISAYDITATIEVTHIDMADFERHTYDSGWQRADAPLRPLA